MTHLRNPITIKAMADCDPATAWHLWTTPEHILGWNHASADWHTTAATSDLRAGGSFSYTMAARDGSVSFDLKGTFTTVAAPNDLAYTLEDGRQVVVRLEAQPQGGTMITEIFEPEEVHTPELQQQGWQAILDSFCQYVQEHAAATPPKS